MKKYFIALAALASISGAALADSSSNGDSKYSSEEFANPTAVVEPANADAESPILVKKLVDDREQRRLDEKNGSSD